MIKKKAWTRQVDRRMRDYGEIDYTKKKIRVNPNKRGKGGIADTILHEELHRLYPEKTEKAIVKMTRKRLKKMSLSRIGDMLKRYKERRKRHYRTD